ncbi:unnamed protein product, partial [Symbiodinium microadriaticum]
VLYNATVNDVAVKAPQLLGGSLGEPASIFREGDHLSRYRQGEQGCVGGQDHQPEAPRLRALQEAPKPASRRNGQGILGRGRRRVLRFLHKLRGGRRGRLSDSEPQQCVRGSKTPTEPRVLRRTS